MTTYRSPALTVDIIIEYDGGIVLIERRNPPHGYALPGGFVDYGETVEAAAVREAAEETNLNLTLQALLGVYSDPTRDPRQHTVSTVFVGQGAGELRAQDDAKHVLVADLDHLPSPLCFDHAKILIDYRAWRRSGRSPAPRTPLDAASRQSLVELARQSLSAAVSVTSSSIRPLVRGGPLAHPGACVVTIRDRAGALVGRAWSAEPRRTLATAVEEVTFAAATEQAARAIQRSEVSTLRIEIDVMGASQPIASPSDLVVGRQGAIVQRGEALAVATPDAGSDAAALLSAACVQAGWDSQAWQQPDVRLFAFESERVVATDD